MTDPATDNRVTTRQAGKRDKPGPLAAGLAALRRFYRPFLLIQSVAVLLGVAYYRSDAVRAFCGALAEFKTSGGLPFAALTASVAGGILPELAKMVGDWRRYDGRRRGSEIVFNLAFFAFNGVVIDLLYRGEAWMFGGDASVATVAKKVAFDQFIFTPSWLPLIVALYAWQRERFTLAPTLAMLRAPGFYKTRVLPLLLSNFFFWIPMVSVIYALPTPLQFLFFILALAAWSLIMVSIASADLAAPADGPSSSEPRTG